jgi:DNA-binding transcriptional regulator YiaG
MSKPITDELTRIAERTVQRLVAPLSKRLSEQQRQIDALMREAATASKAVVATGNDSAALTPARIRGIRKGVGLSQQAFAEKIGCSPQAVYNWEGGHSKPKASSVERILAAAPGAKSPARGARKASKRRSRADARAPASAAKKKVARKRGKAAG